MKTLNLTSIVVASFFVQMAMSFAQPKAALTTIQNNDLSPRHRVFVSGSSGFGIYPDLQIPEYSQELRADGSTAKADSSQHGGIPISLNLGWQRQSLHWVLGSALDFMQIKASTGRPETASASYSRYQWGLGTSYAWQQDGVTPLVRFDVMMRRSIYQNISSGHYVNALITRVGLGWSRVGEWQVLGYGGFAPVSEFGYQQGGIFKSNELKSSKVSFYEYGLTSKLALSGSSWFDFGVEREANAVQINNIMEYNQFGLNVSERRNLSRKYDLMTSIVHIGLGKSF